ncbi:VOC family protein [Paracraurococcus lichenis]|uniref:VOC family protein n=1 Tax=Paracraurococcus lichenis TaxID=3064888 RepID=A0ABT9E4J5_9PROT|nr:VOC family protein [Paracraurococcus sp. LOR1-02]MDO9711092.1 VOC family protein [Paracraurococcus sp. LOR1-02]
MARYGFDHIHLRSPDLEATATWFRDKLGAEEVRRVTGEAPRIDMTLGGLDLFISQSDNRVAAPPVSPYNGIDHFGLAVQGLDEAVADLKAKGVAFTMEPKQARPGVRICFIKGPQDITIELLERTPA